jgi:hypothetical protein
LAEELRAGVLGGMPSSDWRASVRKPRDLNAVNESPHERTMAPNFRIEYHEHGAAVVLTGPFSKEARAVAARVRAAHVVLNRARGWSDEHVDFLPEFDGVSHVSLLARDLHNLSGLSALTGLRTLHLEVSGHARIEPSGFGVLEEFAGEWQPSLQALFSIPSLRRLRLVGYNHDNGELIATAADLQRVSLYSTKLQTVEHILRIPALECLSLSYLRRLRGITVPHPNSVLRELILRNVATVGDLAGVALLSALRVMVLENCRTIPGLGPLGALRALSVLRIEGSTTLSSNDVSVLLRLPELQHLRLPPSKDYDPPVSSLPANWLTSVYTAQWL